MLGNILLDRGVYFEEHLGLAQEDGVVPVQWRGTVERRGAKLKDEE